MVKLGMHCDNPKEIPEGKSSMNGVVQKPMGVLLVEDNPADVRLAQEAFLVGETDSKVHAVDNSRDALQFLRNEGNFATQPRPDLVLLDLNLNGESGLDILSAIKSDERLRMIPVVILTTSNHERDIAEAYQRGANCYINKPLDLEEFMRVIYSLEHFWFRLARLPS